MLFGKKRKQAQQHEAEQAALQHRLNGRSILYAALRDMETAKESIICRDAVLNVLDDSIAIFSDGHEVIRLARDGAELGELMSLGGAVITGVDQGGIKRMIIAYYTTD